MPSETIVEANDDAGPFADTRQEDGQLAGADGSRDVFADRFSLSDVGFLPHPKSTQCGDAIRDPVTEECDEGAVVVNDTCTTDCRVRAVTLAAAAAPPDTRARTDPYLGTAAHVAAGGDSGLALIYEQPGAALGVALQLYSESGSRLGSPLDVTDEYAALPAANAAVAALPAGQYAVAWTDGTASPSEVRLRLVDGQTLGQMQLAHQRLGGLHSDPDLLWTGDRLVVAFTDLLDVTYREFAADLTPLTADLPIAATSAIESSVTLAGFAGGWAAAIRSNSDALERIVIKSGDLSWSTPPVPPGPPGDRPALVAIDDTHLLVLFTVGTDPPGTGTADVGKVMWAVASVSSPGLLSTFALDDALTAPPGRDVSERRPSATRVGDRIYMAWTNTVADGFDGEQVFISGVVPDRSAMGGLAFDAPISLPVGGAGAGWQSNLHLASSPLFPEGALISTWESASDGSSLATVDLMLDFRPSPFVFLK